MTRDHLKVLEKYRNILPSDLTIYFDLKYEFFDLNNYPKTKLFNTFLLDNSNRIVLMGDPIYNSAMQELYLKNPENQ